MHQLADTARAGRRVTFHPVVTIPWQEQVDEIAAILVADGLTLATARDLLGGPEARSCLRSATCKAAKA
jgi:hypothetical protein